MRLAPQIREKREERREKREEILCRLSAMDFMVLERSGGD